ncbi:MAG: hypothetical protein PHW18_12860 [Sulfuricurvum sp.]|jgi:hypothetical protein|uniref:hypothetical protein n=1 Tax=Sulfuricurvum sp. TaxID=2025608 RepID=UPI002628E303|nr:hypothetical protein [Sulfuricurvum sp.]MDD2830457.1 hypothetical protein [Sulfuricurvum sp.]MDD4950161.1 hypothetical protein [Sulfuricurvum sp.]
MSLIETFTDYVLNRKSLKEYVEVRKTINERGEFNDEKLIQAEENLQRLKNENPEVYEGMYETLARIYAQNAGLTVEYPLDFIRQVLKMYQDSHTPKQICQEYRRMLEHYHHDV